MWDRPLFSELPSSLRRRKPRIVVHDFGIVWRVELVEAGSRNPNLSLAGNDIPRWIDCNDLMVELVADQKPRPRKPKNIDCGPCRVVKELSFSCQIKEEGSSQAREMAAVRG